MAHSPVDSPSVEGDIDFLVMFFGTPIVMFLGPLRSMSSVMFSIKPSVLFLDRALGQPLVILVIFLQIAKLLVKLSSNFQQSWVSFQV